MMMILTDKGLRAVMDDQFKIGADAGGVVVKWGGGVEGATTGAIGADIVGFSRSRGLYAGISLSGSVLATKSDWNQRVLRQGGGGAADRHLDGCQQPWGLAVARGAGPVRQQRHGDRRRVPASVASADPVGPVRATPIAAPPRRQTSYPSVQRQALPLPPRAPALLDASGQVAPHQEAGYACSSSGPAR